MRLVHTQCVHIHSSQPFDTKQHYDKQWNISNRQSAIHMRVQKHTYTHSHILTHSQYLYIQRRNTSKQPFIVLFSRLAHTLHFLLFVSNYFVYSCLISQRQFTHIQQRILIVLGTMLIYDTFAFVSIYIWFKPNCFFFVDAFLCILWCFLRTFSLN